MIKNHGWNLDEISGNSNSVQTLAINGISSLVRDTDTFESDDDIFDCVINLDHRTVVQEPLLSCVK